MSADRAAPIANELDVLDEPGDQRHESWFFGSAPAGSCTSK